MFTKSNPFLFLKFSSCRSNPHSCSLKPQPLLPGQLKKLMKRTSHLRSHDHIPLYLDHFTVEKVKRDSLSNFLLENCSHLYNWPSTVQPELCLRIFKLKYMHAFSIKIPHKYAEKKSSSLPPTLLLFPFLEVLLFIWYGYFHSFLCT